MGYVLLLNFPYWKMEWPFVHPYVGGFKKSKWLFVCFRYPLIVRHVLKRAVFYVGPFVLTSLGNSRLKSALQRKFTMTAALGPFKFLASLSLIRWYLPSSKDPTLVRTGTTRCAPRKVTGFWCSRATRLSSWTPMSQRMRQLKPSKITTRCSIRVEIFGKMIWGPGFTKLGLFVLFLVLGNPPWWTLPVSVLLPEDSRAKCIRASCQANQDWTHGYGHWNRCFIPEEPDPWTNTIPNWTMPISGQSVISWSSWSLQIPSRSNSW